MDLTFPGLAMIQPASQSGDGSGSLDGAEERILTDGTESLPASGMGGLSLEALSSRSILMTGATSPTESGGGMAGPLIWSTALLREARPADCIKVFMTTPWAPSKDPKTPPGGIEMLKSLRIAERSTGDRAEKALTEMSRDAKYATKSVDKSIIYNTENNNNNNNKLNKPRYEKLSTLTLTKRQTRGNVCRAHNAALRKKKK